LASACRTRAIWLFRERLTRAVLDGKPAIEILFGRFDEALRAAGYIAMSGQIIDATLVAAPRQHNTSAEKAEIKAGRIPTEWQARPAKLRHKDRDARWTLKFTKRRRRWTAPFRPSTSPFRSSATRATSE